MWVEVINVEQSCSVEEAGENSTVIPKRLEKGAGTNSQASEEIFATDFTSVVSRPLHYRRFQPKRTMKQEDNESSAEAFIHRGKPGGGGFFKPNELNSAPENINRLEIALQDIAGFALEPILDDSRIDLTEIGVMLEISVLKLLQTR